MTIREEYLKAKLKEYCRVNNIDPFDLITDLINCSDEKFKLKLKIATEITETRYEISQILGISERSIYRYKNKK